MPSRFPQGLTLVVVKAQGTVTPRRTNTEVQCPEAGGAGMWC